MSIEFLVLAEHRRGSFTEGTAQAVTAAAEMAQATAGRVVLAVAAPDAAALLVGTPTGVDEVVTVTVPNAEFDVDEASQVFTAVVRDRGPKVVLAAYSANLTAVGPRVALETGMGFASDVVAIKTEHDTLVARRFYYGGKVEAELEFPSGGALLLLRPGAWSAAEPSGAPATTTLDVPLRPSRAVSTGLVDPPTSDADISKAEVILAVGRGIGDRENIARFESLADRLGVTLASSRPLVDAGWMPKYRQVGQSGVSVKPRLYLAFGISGAVQHVAGMKGAGTIVAVNTDEQAPIFEVANIGAVQDMLDVADAIEALL